MLQIRGQWEPLPVVPVFPQLRRFDSSVRVHKSLARNGAKSVAQSIVALVSRPFVLDVVKRATFKSELRHSRAVCARLVARCALRASQRIDNTVIEMFRQHFLRLTSSIDELMHIHFG